MMMRQSVKAISSQEVFDDLLEKIINLAYKPGEKISENDLCGVYGTTRHIIRGALASLREKGFVDIYPQRGTFVSLLNLKYIQEVLFIRESVAQEALRLIIENGIDEKYIKALEECVAQQYAMGPLKNKASQFYELDDRFHQLLLESIGMENVFSLLKDAHLHVRRWRNVEVETLARIDRLPDEHKQIIEAIKRKDRKKARELMHTHIDSVNLYSSRVQQQWSAYFV